MEIRIIPGMTKYGAGEDGIIYSRARGEWRPLVSHKNDRGYHYVHIPGYPHRRVSRYVYRAWNGEIGDKLHVNHIDGNKDNNRPDNLNLMTCRENRRHAMENGLWHSPDPYSNPRNKYSHAWASVVKHAYYDEGMKQWEIARFFCIRQSYISLVIHGKRWK